MYFCKKEKISNLKKMSRYLHFPDMVTKSAFLYDLDKFSNSKNSESFVMKSIILKYIKYIDTINDLYAFKSDKFIKQIYKTQNEEICKEFLNRKGYDYIAFGTCEETVYEFQKLGYGNVRKLDNEQILQNYIDNNIEKYNNSFISRPNHIQNFQKLKMKANPKSYETLHEKNEEEDPDKIYIYSSS